MRSHTTSSQLTSVFSGTTCLSPMAMAKTAPIRSNGIGASPSRATESGGERREAAENSEVMGPILRGRCATLPNER